MPTKHVILLLNFYKRMYYKINIIFHSYDSITICTYTKIQQFNIYEYLF